ncbi:hypothetical protein PIB30_031836 [Stylosanthes scabra]|uniref:Transmembrane protein n=1 Tax=Stylosanthes scabra TaxID=79078 RepID=A0ABU6SBK0_9FABA|nr:hypothetical protein [Stylosanthes scabra]
MAMEDRDSRLHGGEKGLVAESYSVSTSGGNSGSSGGGPSRKMRLLNVMQTRGAAKCKYFEWLDEYVDCFQRNKGGNSKIAPDPIERIEERIASLETMVMNECNKRARDNGGKFRGTIIFLLGVVVAFCWSTLFIPSK